MDVVVEYRSHENVAATVQCFVNVVTGKRISPMDMVGLKIKSVFPDTQGRIIMNFEK